MSSVVTQSVFWGNEHLSDFEGVKFNFHFASVSQFEASVVDSIGFYLLFNACCLQCRTQKLEINNIKEEKSFQTPLNVYHLNQNQPLLQHLLVL